jgi:hypothetical protein
MTITCRPAHSYAATPSGHPLWPELSAQEKIELTDAARPENRPLKYGQPEELGILSEISDKIVGMPLTAWRRHASELEEQAKEKPTLVLFDIDFHKEGLAQDEGLKELKDLHDQGFALRTGVLSSTLTLADAEEKATEYAEVIGIKRAALVVAGKDQLSADRIMEFVLTLRETALSPRLARLR